jgi:hypothetical protein
MATEYYKPMLDVGSPRVFNVNVMTRKIVAADPSASSFFLNKQLNNLVLIKDTLPESERRAAKSPIGTKLYFPFNENDIYEGGRTVFASDRQLKPILVSHFGEGAFNAEALAKDLRILAVLDRLPSLDPFLLKDVFLNDGIVINEAYFDVGAEMWREIENFILARFEPVVSAAFPESRSSDEKARLLIGKIWEARDVVALKPLILAFRLPENEALEIFAAWKGINFYSFQYERAKAQFVDFLSWLKNLQFPPAVPANERDEAKTSLELIHTQLRSEWQKVDGILRNYQESYDKMFKLKQSSTEFVNFLKNSRKAYWDLGNGLGKTGHATYCWDVMSKRYKDRKLPWEQMRELISLLAKILRPEQAATSVAW